MREKEEAARLALAESMEIQDGRRRGLEGEMILSDDASVENIPEGFRYAIPLIRYFFHFLLFFCHFSTLQRHGEHLCSISFLPRACTAVQEELF